MDFTRTEIDIALKVVANSRQVKNWARSELSFLKVDLTTEAGRKLFTDTCYKLAKRLIKQ